MRSLQKSSLVALAVLCVALWGCASTDDTAVATTDATVTTVNPNGTYVDASSGEPRDLTAEAQTSAVLEKEPIVDTTPSMSVRTTNSTVVSGTSGTSGAVAVDNTATLSTGTTGVSGTLVTTTPAPTTTLDTTPTTVTAVTTPLAEPTTEPMTSNSSLNDQEDTTTTTTTTTTRTRMRKD